MTVVTKIELNVALEPGRVIAIANIVLNDDFIIRNIRVVRRTDGRLQMIMPRRENKAGEWRDMAHPLNVECRERLEAALFPKVKTAITQLKENATTLQRTGSAGPDQD